MAQTMDFQGEFKDGFTLGQDVAFTFGGNVMHLFDKNGVNLTV